MRIQVAFLVIGTIVARAASGDHSYQVLGIFATTDKENQWPVFDELMTELSRRGHNVTVISHLPAAVPDRAATYNEILVTPFLQPDDTMSKDRLKIKNVDEIVAISVPELSRLRQERGLATTANCLKSEKVQAYLKNAIEVQTIDVLIVADLYQEALLYVAEALNCPVVTVSAADPDPLIYEAAGLGLGALLAQNNMVEYSATKLGLRARLNHIWLALKLHQEYWNNYIPRQERLIQAYLVNSDSVGEKAATSKIKDLHKRISYSLLNINANFHRPQPLPGHKMMHVGGLHIRGAKELSADLKQFLGDAHYGAIFVSLSSKVYGVPMDVKVLDTLLQSFDGMKQKILIEWDGKKPAALPKNALIRSWMPRSDVLAHPYVQLHIGHGNLLAVQETIHRMVPIIGIPVTREQELNMKVAVDGGFGLMFKVGALDEVAIRTTIKAIFSNTEYVDNVRAASKLFRDRPMGALEEAIYWVEFTTKFKDDHRVGRQQLMISDWTTIEFFNLDIFAFFASAVAVGCAILCTLTIYLYKQLFSRSKKKDKKIV